MVFFGKIKWVGRCKENDMRIHKNIFQLNLGKYIRRGMERQKILTASLLVREIKCRNINRLHYN